MKPITLGLHRLMRGELRRTGSRVVDKLSEQHGATKRYRALRPVLMNGSWVSLRSLLLSTQRLFVNRLQRDRNLDELFAHGLEFARRHSIPSVGLATAGHQPVEIEVC